ncbi:uncharacterized protein METZ01_LOCUS166112, partial [marine metagenome]
VDGLNLKCSQCQSAVTAQSKYCDQCGSSMTIAPDLCAKCNSTINPNSKYCDQCGSLHRNTNPKTPLLDWEGQSPFPNKMAGLGTKTTTLLIIGSLTVIIWCSYKFDWLWPF